MKPAAVLVGLACAALAPGTLGATAPAKMKVSTAKTVAAMKTVAVKKPLPARKTVPAPSSASAKLADHTHILVVSDFCRTPNINAALGRDHYPNNSALIISPKFRGNTRFGASDPEQLLSLPAKTFSDGLRPVTPADVLATFVSAMKADPRKYLRDGEVITEILR